MGQLVLAHLLEGSARSGVARCSWMQQLQQLLTAMDHLSVPHLPHRHFFQIFADPQMRQQMNLLLLLCAEHALQCYPLPALQLLSQLLFILFILILEKVIL